MLNVDHIVEGSVVRVGNRLRITAQLIEAATDLHLWVGTYERELEDVLKLQDEVARTIAHEVRVKLTPAESERLTRERTVNSKAYEACLRGKFHAEQGNAEDLVKANEYYRLAIEQDPGYALAYARLSGSYRMAAFRGFESGREADPAGPGRGN